MTDLAVAVPEPIAGRSLWGNAWARLKRNRAAMFSLYYLAFISVISVFGPMVVPHEYTTIYGDYVRMPPSLSAYPKPDMIQGALTDAIKRMRADIKEWHQDGNRVIVTVTSTKPIDDRNIRYLDRSDAFDDTRIENKSPDGREVTMSSAVKQQYFFFGTDNTGRDLLSRTLMAGRISLAIGLLAGVVAGVIGVIYGATAGFAGGRVDEVMMRIVDVLYSLPFIFFVIMLVVFFGRNFVLMFLAVGAVLWLDMARIVRGQALSIRRQEYVQAAEAMGVGQRGILLRHVIPNLLGPVVIYMTLLVPQVIILESFLSFLGLGVQEPMTSWGVLISVGAKNIGYANWLLLFPAFFLVSTLFALNFVGDGLRDALDPKDR
ncbi:MULTISPECIES: ABC transporter permease subunit [unclassified Mesorhizobium]|jgi:oligopeptide transport system permease protein|uniref:ABC transporter permease n=1 Tax=unclassified Mesorhizobium TaxID=325217 RepID=UPI000FD973A5|nr:MULTISPECIES: ABC transporter permease subunit [unclassified Mesorhizobium]RWL44439.1 MAG: ABC transporter permease subunit [Mesorhizobium sp.]TGQ11839.1 ABC transporter permease subunit [Mesorhizobium sp. M2E.F.Ca.ET.219.01.1.1]TGS18171.1 ABC transporter permease subunit [Mesorhizobium sp. M2E.F.Ca.ET.209.01.1.1]TGT70477.1 ABC transporter permease subunit [Mesorhizobium sp. M2E.F.Ca.ET.166.01.1.1]TGV98712.1 ABC transporter permease subunit [Mesorhizobium sp. M2E.F.Ca.ET.154.01.1.1]